MRIENASAGMILEQDVVDERGSLLLEKGITLTRTYIEHLKKLNISTISVVDTFSQSLQFQPVISRNSRQELEQEIRILFSLQDYDIFDNKLRTLHFKRIGHSVDNLIEQVETNITNILNIKVQQLRRDDVKHAVNVCLMSLITGLYLKFSPQILHNLAFGALLHDLGKVLVNPNSPDKKTCLHTLYGRHLLLKSSISPLAAIIAAQHHENCDGSGQPLGLYSKELHLLSKIVSIANYYDNAMAKAITCGTSVSEIVEVMRSEGNKKFDQNLLNAFFHTIAVYPVGSLVKLSNNRKAYILSNQARFPLRPKVRMIEDGNASDIDLVFKPNIKIVEIIN